MRVFLSYADKDSDVAAKIAARLTAEGFKVWWNIEVFPSDNWALETGKALEQANAMVVLLSPDAWALERVHRDIQYALTRKRFYKRLIPVLVRPTKGMPSILRSLSPPNWHESPEQALDEIISALRAPARLPTMRELGLAPLRRRPRKLAGVTS
ncbi:MAG: toll/interleukin-1 receptor domain-containing protein [Planctomycetes bacterium]|nr:toll/interleukin-1 receptor domain-containing protein [Planctomycetota bacterium]